MPDTLIPAADDRARAYDTIGDAIRYLVDNYQDQPSLDDLAARAGLSAPHFQKLFRRWAGISPKRFAQYLTLDHARQLLAENHSVLDTAYEVGLSGPSRLHDLFVACEAATPGTVKAKGAGLTLTWGVHASPFGEALVAASKNGLSWLGFVETSVEDTYEGFRHDWPAATLVRDDAATADTAMRAFAFWTGVGEGQPLRLDLHGTNFQIKVWEALLKIPPGTVVAYADVARAIGQPTALRAVGRAVGANPISLVIPCHRVIQSSGVIHNYRWGTTRKRLMLGSEAAFALAGAAA